ncbi:cell division site-positioning protein MapZ family protein [Streptococcus suis]|uniref:cell division site-positioning protein MapZ family protein n=1 Tax=Streptococcus suis TaxID=1307 RepID=UPI000CF5C934|nr:cell division site-positioning protein MapZ family protein [Streptococcus suis]
MVEKNNKNVPQDDERVLDFEDAKELTIGEAVRKHKEIEAGVTDDDGLLDRYIKQHREEIEAQKFETKSIHLPLVESTPAEEEEIEAEHRDRPNEEDRLKPISAMELLSTAEKGSVTPPVGSIEKSLDSNVVAQGDKIEFSEIVEPLDEQIEDVADDDWGQAEEAAKDRKKKMIFWSAAGLLLIGSVATALMWMNSINNSNSNTSTTSTTSQSTSTSSSSTDANVTAFEQLYSSFFTDSSLTKLKNSEFGKLSELKALLDKIDTNSEAYNSAKEKYDNLEKAITAIQAINGQFDKEVIVDGEIVTTATAKADASLSATNTGISSVDSLLASVVNFGRSQQEVAAGSAATTEVTADNAQAAPTNNGAGATDSTVATVASDASAGAVTGSATSYGIPLPEGVALQRDRSRVPYNQALIDDVNNEAWTFNPGILENIVAISQQRGYITGNQYILEKVNIVNGNGYYNMFTPDGSYLFSINCKTGYFVGNGSGHSDALDY